MVASLVGAAIVPFVASVVFCAFATVIQQRPLSLYNIHNKPRYTLARIILNKTIHEYTHVYACICLAYKYNREVGLWLISLAFDLKTEVATQMSTPG